MNDDLTRLQALIDREVRRLATLRRGSAEYRLVLRVLNGLRDRLSLLTEDWTDDAGRAINSEPLGTLPRPHRGEEKFREKDF
jgi:hypothetical protein